jgi:MoaA/NifB/PqqE/SkfB family radical SAM enzyme
MDLILKPSQRCNFSCSFCSSTEISNSNSINDDLDISKVIQFLNRFPNTKNIIVNGGDPLVVSPSFYWKIIEEIRRIGNGTVLHFCTNLWDYYKRPNKWRELFNCEEIEIGTSFDFSGRFISKDEELSVDLFLEIMTKFRNDFDYTPSFVSVVSNESSWRAIDTVRLAKKLNVECKLNYLHASGRSNEQYNIGDMYNIYLDIYEEGLSEFESNTKQMIQMLKYSAHQSCPSNRKCDEGIRNLQPMKDGYEYSSCGAFGDDREYSIDFEKEMAGDFFTPLQSEQELQYMKEECLSCENFNFCNGCFKTVKDTKGSNQVEENCKSMKNFRKRAVEIGLV